MITNTGFSGASGITTAMMVVASIIPTIVLQWKGQGKVD
jgi:hypothetical protein